MKVKAKFGPTLDQIHTTLANGFDGITLTSGKVLTATNTNNSSPSGGRFPFMAFRTGSGTFSPWKDFEWSISWNIPATVRVQGPGEDGEITARNVMTDILSRTMQLTGLPLDEKGQLVPLDDTTIKRFDDGDLTFLCERGAPFVSTFDFQSIDDGLCDINLVFHVEAIMSLDQRELNRMKVGVIGLNAVAPGGLFQDPYAEEGRGIVRVFGPPNQLAFTGFDQPLDPKLKQNFDKRIPFVEQVASVIVTPYSAALSTGTPTQQLTAIARANDYSTLYVTGQAQWQSSDVAIATVNVSGLVSRVAAGACTITALYNGVTSNAVTITSS